MCGDHAILVTALRADEDSGWLPIRIREPSHSERGVPTDIVVNVSDDASVIADTGPEPESPS